jgi:hypothetical protein
LVLPAGGCYIRSDCFHELSDIGLFILLLIWASLWFIFFLLLDLGKNIGKATGTWTVVNAVVTFFAG